MVKKYERVTHTATGRCIKAVEHCASRTGFILPTVLLERERGIARVMERHCSGPWTNNNQRLGLYVTQRPLGGFLALVCPVSFSLGTRSPTSTRDRPTKEWCGCLSRLIIPLARCRWRWCGADRFDIETVSSPGRRRVTRSFGTRSRLTKSQVLVYVPRARGVVPNFLPLSLVQSVQVK